MNRVIPEVFFETAERFSKKTALLYKKEGAYFPITYKELLNNVKIFASSLKKLGIGKGDKVAILSENRPEWVIADLATQSMGGVTVPLHTTFSPVAVSSVLNHCRAKILVVSGSDLLRKAILLEKKLKYLQKIIFLNKLADIEKETFKKDIFHWKTIMARNKGESFEKVFLDPEDICTIIYTSGTTGNPKGVPLTHENILSNVRAVNEIVPVRESDVFLSFLPLSHVLERTVGYYIPILSGATIAYAENIKQLPANFREIMPTVLISVPRVFEKFCDALWDKVNAFSPLKKKIFSWAIKQKRGTVGYAVSDFFFFRKIRKKFGGRLRLAISGGASLSENLAKFFYKIGITIIEGYGLTETSPVISANAEKDFKFGAVGKPISGTKVKIGEDKEILVKGSSVFQGYYRNKKNTAEVFDKQGWFHTGDMGFIDGQGFLTIIGRKKEMLVLSGGKNVWPEPIENLLNNDKFISQSIILGNKRKFVSALIVPDWQEVKIYLKEKNLPLKEHYHLIKDPAVLSVFQKRIDEKINPNLSDFEKIKKFRLLPSEFSQENDELTPTLKLRRHIIEKHYGREIESLYSE